MALRPVDASARLVTLSGPRTPPSRNHVVVVGLGHGEDRQLLERLGAARARALAAVTSTDTTNIEAAIASRAVAPELEVVLRAGDDLASETQFLFHIGTVVHADRVAGELLADLVASAHGPTK